MRVVLARLSLAVSFPDLSIKEPDFVVITPSYWACNYLLLLLTVSWGHKLIQLHFSSFAEIGFEACSDLKRASPSCLFPWLPPTGLPHPNPAKLIGLQFNFLLPWSYQPPLNYLSWEHPLFSRAPLGLNLLTLFQIKSILVGRASEFSVLMDFLSPWEKFLSDCCGVGDGDRGPLLSEWYLCYRSRVVGGGCGVAIVSSFSSCLCWHGTPSLHESGDESHWDLSTLGLLHLG